VGTVKVLKLNKSFPQQQVMLMDIAATFCYTNNYETGIKAGEALNFFTTDLNYQKYACQLYRPDTWVSLTQALNASSAGLEVDFSLIQPNNEKAYTSLKDKWLNIVLSDPVTYLQNKLSFGNKLLIGSDTRALSVFSAQTFSEMVMSIYRLPFDIAISLHLFSLFACISMFILFSLVHMIKKRDSSFILKEDALMLITSMLIWSALSSIAYIGSNGRYTYAITMVSSIIYLSCSSWKSDTEKKHG
jgi:hypothetical protein